MAKGDRADASNQFNQTQNRINAGYGNLYNQMQPNYSQFQNNYNQGANNAFSNYDEIMNGYRNFLSGGNYGMGGNYHSGPSIRPTIPPGGNFAPPGTGAGPNYSGPGAVNSFTNPNFIKNIQTQNTNTGMGGNDLNAGMTELQQRMGGNTGITGGLQLGPLMDSNTGQIVNQGLGNSFGSGSASNSNFGNLSDPNAWMSLVGNDQQLMNWIQQNNPWMPPDLAQYYASKIKGQPGANASEQSGSAQYWLDKMANDPHSPNGGTGGGGYPGAINTSLGGYGEFAQTGGFSPQDIQDLRARGVAPIRSIYSQGRAELDRNRALNPNSGANYNASLAKMNREQSYNTADAMQNVDANIAQMRQQGRLAGLSGLAQTGLLGQGQNLAALQGMTGLYGASPGMAGTFGNQALGAGNQQLELQQLLQSGNLGLLSAYLNSLGIPSDAQNILGYANQGAGIAGSLGLGFA